MTSTANQPSVPGRGVSGASPTDGKAILCEARDAPESVWKIIGEAVASGWGDYGLRHQMWDYYAAVADSGFTDLSVVLAVAGKPVALVLANDAHNTIGYFGGPLFFAFSGERDSAHDSFEVAIFEYYSALARDAGLNVEFFAPRRSDLVLGPLALKAAGMGGASRLVHNAIIDLSADETEIRRAIRKSYRSLINWGERHLTSEIVNHENPDRTMFDAFQAFHARISGRQTRPQGSWDQMFENILANRAELIAGYMDGELLAGTFVNYSDSRASYATGVYDRGRFDKPLSHWPVYFSIIRAKQRGCRIFELGEVFLGPEHDEKERNIAFFKKGFTDRVEVKTIWRIEACPPSGSKT